MNILLLGSGGREHAIAWKIAQSKKINNLYIAPGNAGTSQCGTNVPLSPVQFQEIKEFSIKQKIDMIVVGPEDPLVKGISDFFAEDPSISHISVIGPNKTAALLEGSKDFSKAFMMRHHIPTAAYKTFTLDTFSDGIQFIQKTNPPYVLKADGLAAGKGVVICTDQKEAIRELEDMLKKEKFGTASKKVVIEEYLQGIELSVFIITDGISYKLLPSAKDYKRIGEGDTGLNTGGMGSISPVPFADDPFMKKVEEQIIKPTLSGLQKEKITYKGFIFFGLMNVKENPFVIEYNVRLGDPETESIMPRISSDFVELLEGVAKQNLFTKNITIDKQTCASIILASQGYPEKYEKGFIIENLDVAHNSMVFHAGTTMDHQSNKVITNGGRVLSVTSLGNSLKEALNTSLSNANIIQYKNKYYRKDIGNDLMK